MRPGRRPFRSSRGFGDSDPNTLKPLANLRHLKWRDLHMIEDITPGEFVRRRDSGELWTLLDVREAWEIEIARIHRTIDIPMAEIPARIAELDDSQGIAVVCHSGGRSAQVANYLAQTGFDRVANIVGGIDMWSLDIDDSIPRY